MRWWEGLYHRGIHDIDSTPGSPQQAGTRGVGIQVTPIDSVINLGPNLNGQRGHAALAHGHRRSER